MGTKGGDQSLSWTIFIPQRVDGPSIKHHNWEYLPPVPCGVWWHILQCGVHEENRSPGKLGKPGRGALRACYAGKLHSCKIVAFQQILKHSPTQVNTISRVFYLCRTQRHEIRSWFIVGNIDQLRYSKPLYWKRNPSIRTESPGNPLQQCEKNYLV